MIFAELDIIYDDEWIVAINKPSGLLVHRTHLDPEETQFALSKLRDQIGCWVYPIHRLDKATSGVLLFGKSPETASILGQQILKQMIKKNYLAIVRGYSPGSGTVDYPLPQGRKEERKPAVSHFETISRTELDFGVGIFDTARYSVVSVMPESGRRHQIRKHLKHIFYPIIGDRRYGDRSHNRFFREELRISEMLLHAFKLEFKHPKTGKNIVLIAGLPEHWKSAVEIFPWDGLLENNSLLSNLILG